MVNKSKNAGKKKEQWPWCRTKELRHVCLLLSETLVRHMSLFLCLPHGDKGLASASEALPTARIPRYLAKSSFSWLGLSTAGHRRQRRFSRARKVSPRKPLSSHAVSPISSFLHGSQSFSPPIHKETAIKDFSKATLPAQEMIATGHRWHTNVKTSRVCVLTS